MTEFEFFAGAGVLILGLLIVFWKLERMYEEDDVTR